MGFRGRRRRSAVEQVRIGRGVYPCEHADVITCLAPLERHLSRFRHRDVEIEIRVVDRGSTSPYAVLRCWIDGYPPLVATSRHRELTVALAEVCRAQSTQLDEAADRFTVRRRRRPGIVPLPG